MRFLDLPGHLRQAPPDPTAAVRHLLLDSRRVSVPAGTLFFALRGPRHDGHRYLPALYAQGIRLFVVEAGQPLPGGLAEYPEAGIIEVVSPLVALQAVAARHRAAFGGPVLAITGSNGKTIIKEWLAQLLAPDEAICRSPRSYNSQVGVPLSVWELSPARHTLGIFEAGISEVGEMARLAAVIQPTEGLFTTLGTAHDAGFADAEQKLREKLLLFAGPQCRRLYYCADQPAVAAAVAALGLPGFGWSSAGHPAAAVQFVLEDSAVAGAATAVAARYPMGAAADADAATAHFLLLLPDAPTRQNVLHCLAVLLARGVAPAEIQRRLDRLHPVAMRLEMKQGRHGSYLLDDAYNNDLAGLALALDALARQARPGRRTVILSDVLESGLPPAELYGQVAALLARHGVGRLVAIGPAQLRSQNEEAIIREKRSDEAESGDGNTTITEGDRQNAKDYLAVENQSVSDAVLEPIAAKAAARDAGNSPKSVSRNSQLLIEKYPSTEAFLAVLDPADFTRETILIKGARQFGFERIVAALQAQQHGTVLEVNLDALTHNLNHFRQRLSPGTRIMVMVKAFAYGAGSYEVARLLEFQRADYLAVAYADEGVALREAGISLPIMVMNPAPDSFELLRRYRLEPEIYSFELLDEYLAAVENADRSAGSWEADAERVSVPGTHYPAQPFPIHLKLDTGMHRLGFAEADLPALVARLHVRRPPVASILTHLAAAEAPEHDDFTRTQLAAFRYMSGALEAALGQTVSKHALNSAGIVRFPEAHFDMVRLGIGLYGVDATGTEAADALWPVSALRTTVSQVKVLASGETVGYGRRGAASTAPRLIATLAIGYADGYDRRFGNGAGAVLIRGQLAPVVGSVCMDMCMVDVTHIAGVRAGDAAEVFGPGQPLPALASRIGTIAYELLTNVSERVKRVFVME